jgi:hypothetical protein
VDLVLRHEVAQIRRRVDLHGDAGLGLDLLLDRELVLLGALAVVLGGLGRAAALLLPLRGGNLGRGRRRRTRAALAGEVLDGTAVVLRGLVEGQWVVG